MRLMLPAALAVLAALPAVAATYDETKLLPDAPTPGFASWVGISGPTAIVGARASEAAYLFDIATGQQTFELTAQDGAAGDDFGVSVAISGTTAIVGAPDSLVMQEIPGGQFAEFPSGAAYLFDTTTGEQTARLTAETREFGFSVAVSGTTALVGDYGTETAYLFDTETGAQTARLAPSGMPFGDGDFGWSVALSGTTAIVGADQADNARGAAYLFDTETGDQIARLTAEDRADGGFASEAFFGDAVAISGTTAIVGAYGEDDGTGAAYLFDTETGEQIARLIADDGAEDDRFGASVALSGTTAFVGALYDDDDGENSGSVYLFDIETGAQIAKLTASDGAAGDNFSFPLAVSGETFLVAARGSGANGAAYLYTPSDTAAAPVPLPAGIWLLGTALGAGGLVLRRRA